MHEQVNCLCSDVSVAWVMHVTRPHVPACLSVGRAACTGAAWPPTCVSATLAMWAPAVSTAAYATDTVNVR